MSNVPSDFVPNGRQTPQDLTDVTTKPSYPPVGTEAPTQASVGTDATRPARTPSEAGQHTAHVAQEETKKVASEAGTQARKLLHEAGGQLREQAAVQQVRLAGGIRNLGSQLSEMANNSNETGPAVDLARQASERAQAIAQWLDAREPGALVDEVKSFARQRPGVFLGIAAAAGLVAGRLTKALASPSSSGSSSTSTPNPDTYSGTYGTGDSYDR